MKTIKKASKSRFNKFIFSTILTTAILTGAVYAWTQTNVPYQTNGTNVTETIWNELVDGINNNGANTETNSLNIATNTSNISTNTTDIATNTTAISNLSATTGGKFVDGANTNDAVYTGGNVGIGTNIPSSKLHILSGIEETKIGKQIQKNVVTTGGWARHLEFQSNGSPRGTFGAYGSNNILNYLYIDARGGVTPYIDSQFKLKPDGKIIIGSSTNRLQGIYGVYNYKKAANIWSMGEAYKVAADGSTLGNLYGLAYKYSSYGGGGTLAGGHQMVWNQNGTPYFAAGNNVWVKNNVYASAFIYNSDKRLKKNISTVENSLDKINKLRGVDFNWKKDGRKDIGVIAQEVEKVLPELVHTDKEGMKSVEYGNFIGVLIEGVKELYNKVMGNTEEIEKLKSENIELKNRLKLLEEKIDKLIK